jgi:hypothetical protein
VFISCGSHLVYPFGEYCKFSAECNSDCNLQMRKQRLRGGDVTYPASRSKRVVESRIHPRSLHPRLLFSKVNTPFQIRAHLLLPCPPAHYIPEGSASNIIALSCREILLFLDDGRGPQVLGTTFKTLTCQG